MRARQRPRLDASLQASSTALPVLIRAGADIRILDRDGSLAPHRNFRREFIAPGIEVNARNQAGLTPLHFVCRARRQRGGDSDARRSGRRSAGAHRGALVVPGGDDACVLRKGRRVPARSTALDLARLHYRRTRWNTSRYQPIVDLLEKLEGGAEMIAGVCGFLLLLAFPREGAGLKNLSEAL